ncbi:unnamed protein product [Ostreobium quekettii]|uniref:Uncharacterized protein n=1 Tax=Ostreobium quekettii TaxID=121088 RepID=A0A8S1IZ33_9CHLO|nr:unnamed protein product [Ostreobium quekettii]
MLRGCWAWKVPRYGCGTDAIAAGLWDCFWCPSLDLHPPSSGGVWGFQMVICTFPIALSITKAGAMMSPRRPTECASGQGAWTVVDTIIVAVRKTMLAMSHVVWPAVRQC